MNKIKALLFTKDYGIDMFSEVSIEYELSTTTFLNIMKLSLKTIFKKIKYEVKY